MQIYNIESQSKYHMKLERIDNIEDAGDHFITSDELEEMGVSVGWGITTFNKKIKGELSRLVRELKSSKAKSIKIDDQELVDVFVEGPIPVSTFVDGIRRTGNRLSLHTPTVKKKANKRDGKRFINLAIECITSKYEDEDGNNGFHLEVRGGTEIVNERTFNFIRHNMTWKEFEKWTIQTDKHSWGVSINHEDVVWYKTIYDNPKMFEDNT